MLTLLAPAALVGSLLLAIPVAIHLFKPRKMRQTPFSSLRWLRATHQRLSRRIQWHQLLLFLLRAGFILLLVVALARPLFSPGAQGRPVDRYIVLDISRSMGYQAPGRPTPLERAKQFAAELMTATRANDRIALLLTGTQTRVVTPPTFNARAFLPALETVHGSASDTDLSSALAVIRPMLAHARPEADVELYVLTDNHQHSWNQVDVAAFVKDLPVPLRVQLVDLGVTGAQNGWIARARLFDPGDSSRRMLRIDLGCVGDSPQERTVRVTGLGTLPDRVHAVTLEPGQPTIVEFELPAALDLRGQVAKVTLEPPDALPGDDEYFLSLDNSAAPRVLLVEADAGADESSRTGFYLRSAIEALAPESSQGRELVIRTAASVSARDIAAADVVVLAGVPELADDLLASLEARVAAGGGLVLFLGDAVKEPFYNEKLYKPLRPADSLLPCPLKGRTAPQADTSTLLTNVRWSHRLLSPLHDPRLGDLAQARFHTYYRFAASPAETDTVLAWMEGDVPAIVEHPVGAGKVILLNTSANDDWGTLPRRGNGFVAFVDNLLTYLAAAAQRSFEVGDAVALPLADRQAGETVQVGAPGGAPLTAILGSANGRTLLQLREVTEPGVYRVERSSGKSFAFVVNVGRGDSVLTPADPAILTQWWQPAAFEVVSPDIASKRLSLADPSLPLWPALVGLAALLLLLETYFVHRLCPRVNPTVADVVVHRRGLLRPLSSTGEPGA
jgi:von Willebrand factor type A domain/Aerotolerance regulator N-terminal